MFKYNQKKSKNQEVITYIVKHVSANSLENIKTCGDWLQMVTDKTMEHQKLNSANFCKNRFCPMCSWRMARKEALKISVLMKYIKDKHDKEFIFLTLTTPNVEGDKLNEEINKYNHSFQKLMQRKEVKNIAKGYIRKLEVTYNKDRNDYHPHFHVMIAVNKSYFTDTKQYISQSRWLEIWQQTTGDPSITQVNVKKIRTNDNKEVAEIAKYGAKDADYLVSQEVFDIFYTALKGKRILVYSGLFKDVNSLFKNKKLNDYLEIDQNEYIYSILYQWGFGKYVETEKRELTEREYKKINKELITEMEIEND